MRSTASPKLRIVHQTAEPQIKLIINKLKFLTSIFTVLLETVVYLSAVYQPIPPEEAGSILPQNNIVLCW